MAVAVTSSLRVEDSSRFVVARGAHTAADQRSDRHREFKATEAERQLRKRPEREERQRGDANDGMLSNVSSRGDVLHRVPPVVPDARMRENIDQSADDHDSDHAEIDRYQSYGQPEDSARETTLQELPEAEREHGHAESDQYVL